MSIPIRSKADGTYYSYGDHEITYNGYLYGFYITSASTSGLPNNYQINQVVFEEIISSDAKGLQYDLANRADTHGIVIADWILNGVDSFANFIFSSYANYLQATGSFIHDFIWRGATTYSWNYYFTGADPDYPGSGDYGTAYGFRFIGAAGEKFDIVLDANGDYYGSNLIGNWTPSDDPGPTNWILINQGLDNFYVPSTSFATLEDFKPPYIDGKTLHFFIYNGTEYSEVIVPDFTNTVIWFSNQFTMRATRVIGDSSTLRFFVNGASRGTYFSGHNSYNYEYDGIHGHYFANGFLELEMNTFVSNVSNLSFNYPLYGQTSYTPKIYSPDYLGMIRGTFQQGYGDIWLGSFPYTTNPQPQPFPEDPIPITSIPEDPEDPVPQTTPDPVPGIEYPVNPTPPTLKPVPSIVSGNDDLWPSVVELQNIEIDLSGYLSSLGDFEFPDLNTITESFGGSIIWVSALMSSLFNGSDFSILFAVLSSFFIVAALLGLYKWWNHK